MSFDIFVAEVLGSLFSFLDPGSRIYALYLLTALILAFVAYLQIERLHTAELRAEGRAETRRVGFLAYVFNPKIWTHPSALLDMRYFVVNSAVYYGLLLQFFVGSAAVSTGFYTLLTNTFSIPETALISGPAGIALYTLASVLALDFGVYIMHYAFHRNPVLWEFHKVHHSAEEMTPMTLFRMHPVDLLLTSASVTFFQALAYGGFYFLTASEPQMASIYGLNVVLFGFYLFGYNLRHTHIWLNFPVWLSKILVSPAQHQIHHSSDPKHFDRNMGLIFSFWDQLFKTHYIPREREQLSYGLSRHEPSPFQSISEIYIKPFKLAYRQLRQGFSTMSRRLVLYASATLLTCVVALAFQKPGGEPGLPSLKLADLTWTEVHSAINRGYTTVIIPTGGTEQNGPFVVLGKHHHVVDRTSAVIAEKLGKTLVAPVMDYVPEGDISPQTTGHMSYAGTISLPEKLFQGVLEATARSLHVHGFEEIYFLGDSGGNQAAQISVAGKLMKEWAGTGVRVASLDAYYDRNGQFDHLLSEGFSQQEIGYHAGMRDTSELLAIDPSMVRLEARNVIAGTETGHSGDALQASAALGRKMLDLKINAALEQIRSLRNGDRRVAASQ